jgi:glycosyltransferase involved in cell wall biosynthesis
MPIRNEAAHLEEAVGAVLAQDYPGELEICLAVGPSDDGTEAIAERLAAQDPRVRVVANPSGRTPAGLNLAIAATTAPVVVRVDGHAELSAGYVRRAVETLQATGAVNVGGMQVPRGETPFERAIAIAMTSRFGTGGSRFHVGGEPGPVDTVYLGVFDRAALEAVGGFDETLIRNQDYELNVRLRQAGGTVWFDPELRVGYRPRPDVARLARQYREYGWWKYVVLRRHPDSWRLRQLVPVLATVALGVALPLALIRRTALVVPAAYAAAVTFATLTARAPLAVARRLLVVYPVMHLSWGAGFLGSAAEALLRTRRRRPDRPDPTG